eukprot:CAMPEP_0171063640 /NCGR_PEP_ID=MMETSP0766_2-20121228/5793_1 /TAXON_ID=439317 /ORGANISM="Gambierdiscus australes, Strain CAWD 149" /LENGTH=557 /DNA_ID=CAMNT_0011519577 /DNA_START=78 /DNA_END=1748 /DNA_ORIENTATION=+
MHMPGYSGGPMQAYEGFGQQYGQVQGGYDNGDYSQACNAHMSCCGPPVPYGRGTGGFAGGSFATYGGSLGRGPRDAHSPASLCPQDGMYGSYGLGSGAVGSFSSLEMGLEGESDGFGWRQEYSAGTVPEYQAETLWTTQEEDDGMAEVSVFGPSGDQVPPAVTSFEAAAQLFPPQLLQRLQCAGFTAPTPIQAHTWAIAVAGRDLIGIAKTGSGKTLAFLLPGFLRVMQTRMRPPLFCVLAPTRELACQIEVEADKFGRSAGIRTACCYGGAPRGQQLGALRRGAQVVVACPGRLNDFIQSGAVHLQNIGYLVLDEADRMLDMGFEPQIRQIIAQIPESRQTLLFTATWPREVRSLASEFLQRPIHVQTGGVNDLTVNKDIEQHVIFVANEQDKAQQLIQLLQGLGQGDRCLIFCEMKRSAEVLANDLINYYGVPAVRIHGDMAQYERTRALDAFKTGRSPILVATDVAARGIDVKGISVVVNYDASGSAKDYVHRIGRTGRAGQKGLAYSFLLPREEKKAQDIIQVLQRSNLPIPEELQSRVSQRRQGRPGGKGSK